MENNAKKNGTLRPLESISINEPIVLPTANPREVESFNISEISRTDWENIIIGFASMDDNMMNLPSSVNFTGKKEWEHNILSELYVFDKRIYSGKDNKIHMGYVQAKRKRVLEIVSDIRKRKQYFLIPKLVLASSSNELPEGVKGRILKNAIAIYLLSGDPDKVLVGVKDGAYWKKTNFQGIYKEAEVYNKYLELANKHILNLPSIGSKELFLVPDNPMMDEQVDSVKIPRPAKSSQDLLEEAFYKQRYMVPIEGAEVRFRHAGDVERVVLKQTGNELMARVYTKKGEIYVSLDLEDGHSTSLRFRGDEWLGDITGNLVAEVYRDLVTAVELPRNRHKKLSSKGHENSKGEIELLQSKPQFIYIPRVLRQGDVEDRPLYDGPVRPITPHRVSGHLRKANMTEKHRLELLKFEQENGIQILKYIPTGYTYVRPFIIPFGGSIIGLPTFIKRRIETQIQHSIQAEM
jgi:hypothetical protein